MILGCFSAISSHTIGEIRVIRGVLYRVGHIPPHLDHQAYLFLGMSVGLYLCDATFEEVAPAHVEEDGELLIVGAGDVAYVVELLFALVVVAHGNGIGVVAVVGFAYEAEWGAYLELIPHFIGIVIHTASEVAIHEILLLCFHTFL